MPAARSTLTSANRPYGMGNAQLFMGDLFTVDGLEDIGPTEGPASENITWQQNVFNLPEQLGGIPLDVDVQLAGATITVPVIGGSADIWERISPLGTKSAGSSSFQPAIEVGVLLIGRNEIGATALSYNGTTWTPAAPKNALWFP